MGLQRLLLYKQECRSADLIFSAAQSLRVCKRRKQPIEVFCFFLLAVSRFVAKLLYLESVKSREEYRKVLIYGAGISGMIAKQMIERDLQVDAKIFAFIDDNKRIDN